MPDGTWDSHSEQPVHMDRLLKDRTLDVLFIAAIPEFNILRIAYHEALREGFPLWEEENENWLHPGAFIDAVDGAGTEYEDVGGGRGPRQGGTLVEGEVDIHPVPPRGTQWIDLTYLPWEEWNIGEQEQFVLRVPLPVPELTFEGWQSRTKQYWLER